MGTTKKPRKRYQPKPVNPLAHKVGLCGVFFVDDAAIKSRDELLTAAVDAACIGQGTKDHWRCIFDAVNTLEAMIELKLADGAGVEPAMRMMDDVLTRAKRTGSFALRYEERDLLHKLRDTYTESLLQLTNAELFQVENHVSSTIRRALQGDKNKTRVIDAEHMAFPP